MVKKIIGLLLVCVMTILSANAAFASDNPISTAVRYVQYSYPNYANAVEENDGEIVRENDKYYMVSVNPDWEYPIRVLVIIQKETGYVVYAAGCQDYLEIEDYLDEASASLYADFNGLNTNNDITILVNGNKISFEQAPYNENGTIMVPMRAVFEALGADVAYNSETKTITAVKNGTTLELMQDSNLLKLNGIVRENYHSAINTVNKNGYMMVGLRLISDALGSEVNWDTSTKTITIIDNNNNPYVGYWAPKEINETYSYYNCASYMIYISNYENGLISGKFIRNQTNFRDYGIEYNFNSMPVSDNKFTLNLADKWNHPLTYEGDTGIGEWTSSYVVELDGSSIKVSNPDGMYGEDVLVKYLKSEFNALSIYVK